MEAVARSGRAPSDPFRLVLSRAQAVLPLFAMSVHPPMRSSLARLGAARPKLLRTRAHRVAKRPWVRALLAGGLDADELGVPRCARRDGRERDALRDAHVRARG